jgi:prepilin peptidase CpaA
MMTSLPLATFPADKAWLVMLLSIAMIVMAVVDFRYLKIHNKLTFPVIFAGWIFAFIDGCIKGASIEMYIPLQWTGFLSNVHLFDLDGSVGGAIQGLWHSIGLSFLGLGLLVWLYAIGGVGAGDVKMQMGFGAWVAPIYGWDQGLEIVLWGWIFGVIIGGVISAFIIWWNGSYRQNVSNVREIVSDWVKVKDLGEIHDRAMARKKKLQLLPYGVPLCIGYLAYVAWDWINGVQHVVGS